MPNILGKVGAVLSAVVLSAGLLCFSAVPLAALSPSHVIAQSAAHHQPWTAPVVILLAMGLAAIAGTVTLTYNSPVQGPTLGGTVAPTAAQAVGFNVLSVTVNAADADTTIALVHNWGLSAAEITANFPIVTVNLIAAGTAVPTFTGFVSGANTMTVTKANAAGSGGTYLMTLNRVHSLVR